MGIIHHLHVHLGLPPVDHEYFYHTEQLTYDKHQKSNWWYETVPAHSTLAAGKFGIASFFGIER